LGREDLERAFVVKEMRPIEVKREWLLLDFVKDFVKKRIVCKEFRVMLDLAYEEPLELRCKVMLDEASIVEI